MKSRLLDYLCCPACQRLLSLTACESDGEEIMTGTLSCGRCRHAYPILGGIPRFLPGIAPPADLRQVDTGCLAPLGPTDSGWRDEDEREFFQITDWSGEDLAGKIILDAGCGSGRFSRVVSRHGGELIGLDNTLAIERAFARTRECPNVHFVQADIHHHPFRDRSFDIVYSHGALHHTPNTRQSFDHLSQLVKPQGHLYIAVYHHTFTPLRWSDRLLRAVLKQLPPNVLDRMCGAMSYLAHLPGATFWNRFVWFPLQKTHAIRKRNLLDWYGATYRHEHTAEEVMGWFILSGFTNVQYINACPNCPCESKYALPGIRDRFRLGKLLGVRGRRSTNVSKAPQAA